MGVEGGGGFWAWAPSGCIGEGGGPVWVRCGWNVLPKGCGASHINTPFMPLAGHGTVGDWPLANFG